MGQGSDKPLWKKKRFYIPAALVVMGIIGSATGSGDKTADTSNAASDKGISTTQTPAAQTAAQKAAADKAAAQKATAEKAAADKAAAAKAAAEAAKNGPSDERAFSRAVTTYKNQFDGTDNELKQRQIQKKRNDAVCAVVPGRQVTNWVGRINNLDTNGGGKAVLELQIGQDTKVSTWNNAFSDISDNTLIPMDSALYNTLVNLSSGDHIRFSGRFFSDDTNCLEEQSLTLVGQMDTPSFVFRFSAITPLK